MEWTQMSELLLNELKNKCEWEIYLEETHTTYYAGADGFWEFKSMWVKRKLARR